MGEVVLLEPKSDSDSEPNVKYTLTEFENQFMTAEEIEYFLKKHDETVMAEAIGVVDSDCDLDVGQLELIYNKNYTVKELNQVLHYYGIYKPKMTKDEIIQTLLFYETDANNHSIVLCRMRLWENINELKRHPFFSKYILF